MQTYASIIFKGEMDNVLNDRLWNVLESRERFIATQVNIPPAAGFKSKSLRSKEDHAWHDVCNLTLTDLAVNDASQRTITQFVEEIEAASKQGWDDTQ